MKSEHSLSRRLLQYLSSNESCLADQRRLQGEMKGQEKQKRYNIKDFSLLSNLVVKPEDLGGKSIVGGLDS